MTETPSNTNETDNSDELTVYQLKDDLSEFHICDYVIEKSSSGDLTISLNKNKVSNDDRVIHENKVRNLTADISEKLVELGYEFKLESDDEEIPTFTVTDKYDTRYQHELVSNNPPNNVYSERVLDSKFAPIPPTDHIDSSEKFFTPNVRNRSVNEPYFDQLDVLVGDVWYSNDAEKDEEKYYLVAGFNVDQMVYYDLLEGEFFMTMIEVFEDMMIDDKNKTGYTALLPTPFSTTEQDNKQEAH